MTPVVGVAGEGLGIVVDLGVGAEAEGEGEVSDCASMLRDLSCQSCVSSRTLLSIACFIKIANITAAVYHLRV
jgi:hypothetical protein